jgi:hypothetical protein
MSNNTSPKPTKPISKKYIFSVYSKKPVNDMAKVFVLPRDYLTHKYNPMLYEESIRNDQSVSLTHRLPTIDDAEYASKSIQDASLVEDRLISPLSTSKVLNDTTVISKVPPPAPYVPALPRDNDKKYYSFL